MTRAGRPLSLVALLVLGVVAGSLAAQTPPQTPAPQTPQVFRSATALVPVDVRVLDRSGKPVTDLTEADFTVLENGVRQPLRLFTTQTLTAETPASTPAAAPATRGTAPTVPTAAIAPQNRRIFLIVLGRGRLQAPAKGVDGMMHFVRERLLPQDLVAVLAWNRATEFTTDHTKIADVLERFKKAHEGVESKLKLALSGLAAIYGSKDIPPALQGDINAVFGGEAARGVRSIQAGLSPSAARMKDDTRKTTDLLLEAPDSDAAQSLGMTLDEFVGAGAQTTQDLGNLYMGVEYLRHMEGEKHLVFVSESGLMLPRAEDDKDLASVATDARVVIDYIHTSGTPMGPSQSRFSAENRGAGAGGGRAGPPPLTAPPNMWIFATARTLADLTGGRFYANQFPNAAADMDRIDLATRFEYILGYYPSNPTMDGKYRHITVRVNRPGLTVLYRHGYYANAEVAPFDLDRMRTYSRVAAAANFAKPVPDISVRATAALVRGESTSPKVAGPPVGVRLELTIDPSHFTFEKKDGRNVDSFELAVFCLDSRDGLVGESWKTVELTFTDERLKVLQRDGITIKMPVDVTAEPKNVKIVVYDHGADLVGSVVVKVQ